MDIKATSITPVNMTGISLQSTRRCVSAGKDIFTPSMPDIMNNAIDTFIKSNPLDISAGVRFHRILHNFLPEIMTPQNFINNGRQSKVYRISDDYAAKIRRGYTSKNAVNIFSHAKVSGRKFGQIDMYCGEPLISCGNVEILRNAAPKGKSMPCGTPYYDNYVPVKELEKYYGEYLPACSALPQSSYDEFALNLKKLNEIESRNIKGQKVSYIPDIINPNNLIISNGKFKLVDSLEKVRVKNPNTLFTMLEPLVINIQAEKPASYYEPAVDMRKNIIKKSFIAAEKANLPFENELKGEFSDWVLGDITGSHVCREVIEKLKYFRETGVPLKERVAYITKRFKKTD